MRILYLSQYFPPEVGATQMRAYEMARAWVERGAEVTMICEVPNHPSGVIAPEYRGALVRREEIDGIEVIRVWVKTAPEKGFAGRMAFYLSFMLHATVVGLVKARGPYDLVYATSPPLFVGGAGLALSVLRRTALVFEIRDLWPGSAVALGELNNRLAIHLAEWLEWWCYRRARRIVAVAAGAVEELRQRGIPDEKLLLVPNGSNVELFRFDEEARARVRSELGLDNTFVVAYIGIHGLAQKLETVVEAAALLADDESIRFLLVGAGPRRAAIRALVDARGLVHVSMLDEQPREAVPGLLSAADLALAPMRDVPVLDRTMLPVKIYDAWACERPVVLGNRGAAAALLEEAGGGVAVTPEDPRELAAAIRQLKNDPHGRRDMGCCGRRYVVEHHSRTVLAGRLFDELLKCRSG